ncbi:MAG: hypothetical protein HC893_11515 [Chloroflexaceae bacterium]|nr:hypothetical protein [Chloroflexaceae bacterium]
MRQAGGHQARAVRAALQEGLQVGAVPHIVNHQQEPPLTKRCASRVTAAFRSVKPAR